MRHWLLAAYCLVCLVCLLWPVYAEVGGRIEPFVLGLPLAFAWMIGWMLLTFAVLLVYHLRCEHLARARARAVD
jgi:hypothetical protein